MPLKVTPMVCTFNLCSPPTKKNYFENFRKTGKEQDWLKPPPPFKNGTHFCGAKRDGLLFF